MKLNINLLLFLSLSIQYLFAQTYAEDPGPFNNLLGSSGAFSDIDNDGDEDMIVTSLDLVSFDVLNKLYINDGGTFTEVISFEGSLNSSIAFSDVDNNGYEDLLIADDGNLVIGSVKLYLNDGGNFTEATNTPFQEVLHSAIDFSDVDNDGDEDLFITGISNQAGRLAKLYLNDGGNFTEVTGTSFEGIIGGNVAFSDVDSDGDEDLFMTGRIGSETIVKLYMNEGGSFTEATNLPFESVRLGTIAFSDVEGDGDEDLVIMGSNDSSELLTKLYLNDGGTFTEAIDTPFEALYKGSITFTDVDSDGDKDLLLIGENSSGELVSSFFFNDEGTFTEAMDMPFEGLRFSLVAVSDMDNDGDEDLLITGDNDMMENSTKLYFNETMISSVSNHPFPLLFDLLSYPNPSSTGQLNITFYLQKRSSINTTIYDWLGRPVQLLQQEIGVGKQVLSFDISGLEKGTYTLQIKAEDRVGTQKIIVP